MNGSNMAESWGKEDIIQALSPHQADDNILNQIINFYGTPQGKALIDGLYHKFIKPLMDQLMVKYMQQPKIKSGTIPTDHAPTDQAPVNQTQPPTITDNKGIATMENLAMLEKWLDMVDENMTVRDLKTWINKYRPVIENLISAGVDFNGIIKAISQGRT